MNEKISKSQIVEFFRRAGWYENRKVDISEVEKYYQECNYPMFESTKKFFQEFYKLPYVIFNFIGSIHYDYCMQLQEADFGYDFVYYMNLENDFCIDKSLGPYQMKIQTYKYEDITKIQIITKEKIQYLGDIGYFTYQLDGSIGEIFIDEFGKLYRVYDTKIYDNLFDMVYQDTIELKNIFEKTYPEKFEIF